MGPKHNYIEAISNQSRDLLDRIIGTNLDTSGFNTEQVEGKFLNDDYHILNNELLNCLNFYKYQDIVLQVEDEEEQASKSKRPKTEGSIKDISTNQDRSVLYDPSTMTMTVFSKGKQVIIGLMNERFESKRVGRFGILVKTNGKVVGMSVPVADGEIVLRKKEK